MEPKKIKVARALMEWTQADLAKAAGLSVQTIKDIERGAVTPKEETKEKIRRAFLSIPYYWIERLFKTSQP